MPRRDAITFKQLRALRAVAERGSLTAAADALGLTPPAVHTQIKGLETSLGTRVLESSGAQGAILTAAGEVVLQLHGQMETLLDTCLDTVRALRQGQSGMVTLGVVSTGKYFAPGLVAELQKAFPEITVNLRVGNRLKIIDDLHSRSLNLAIMGRPPRSPATISHILGPHPHIIIAAPDHPLATKDHVCAKELMRQTFITREDGSGTRILMDRYLDRLGEGTPYREIEMGSNETIKQAVIADLGIAMISYHTAVEELRSGRLVALKADGLPVLRQWHLLYREDTSLPPAVENVRDYILGQQGCFLPHV